MVRRGLALVLSAIVFFYLTGFATAGQGNWARVADGIGKALHTAQRSYDEGRANEAMEAVSDAYFGLFEGTDANMEIAVRRFLSLRKAATLEKGFSDIRKAMSSKARADDVRRLTMELARALKETALRLDEKGVKFDLE
ncbi:MAG: hypothetical protein HY886_04275 [Deltaproteobacteria bacterium]|nr:hypothetical protein [Deltaproteobacteria bacterium]